MDEKLDVEVGQSTQQRYKGYDRIMARADEAMYVSKRTGKNSLTVFNEEMYGESFGKHGDVSK